jgi:L-2-hydroxyglutarate oxidase LhgO
MGGGENSMENRNREAYCPRHAAARASSQGDSSRGRRVGTVLFVSSPTKAFAKTTLGDESNKLAQHAQGRYSPDMAEELDCAVIGGGVVGLAIARSLALRGRQVVLFEAEKATGLHTSSRNSEVLHAGIYYPTGSLKARLCVQGRRMIIDYCQARGVAWKPIGKILVAGDDAEIAHLDELKAQATANDVSDLKWLSAAEVHALEPAVACKCALASPSTSLVDSHGLMRSFAAEAQAAGADIVLASPVVGATVASDGIELDIGGSDPDRFHFRTVINSAGFSAPAVARTFHGLDPKTIPQAYFAKGHYFTLSGPAPFRRLVYPVPVRGGLGIHVTLDLEGNVRFGPDVTWVEQPNYRFEESRAEFFYPAIRRYFPALRDGALSPGFVGLRPKLGPADSGFIDFVLQGSDVHGVTGLLNLYGIESPGLTASLALAEEVARRLS